MNRTRATCLAAFAFAALALGACGRGEDPLRGAKDDLRNMRDELSRRSIVIDTEMGGHR